MASSLDINTQHKCHSSHSGQRVHEAKTTGNVIDTWANGSLTAAEAGEFG